MNFFKQTKTVRLSADDFSIIGLRALNVCCCWSLVALNDLKSDCFTCLELIKHDANEVLRVEEKVFRLAFARDETESSICKGLDYSFHLID